VCCLCGGISGAVQTGEKVEARDAGDSLFQQPDDHFTINTFADDVLQCNPRGNSIFSVSTHKTQNTNSFVFQLEEIILGKNGVVNFFL